MYLDNAHLRLRVVAEEHLLVGVFLAFLLVFRTAVHLAAIGGGHGEVIGNIDTVVDKLHTDVAVKHAEVDTLLQRLVTGRIEDVVDHLVQQSLLVNVALAHDFLHCLGGINQRILVLMEYHGLGNGGRFHLESLQLERGIDGAIVGSHGKLVALFDGPQAVGEHGILRKGMAFRLVDVFFQIAQCLVHLQIARRLIERSVDTLVELFLLHFHHLLNIGELKKEQSQKGKPHDDGYGPNR